MTNDEIVGQYLHWLKTVKVASAATVYDYAAILRRYCEFVSPSALEHVTVERMESFVRRPRRGGRVPSAAAQQKDCVVVREVHKFAAARGYLRADRSALLVSPTVRNTNPRPVPDDVWVRLWASDLPDGERAAYGLAFFGGLRRAEVCGLVPSIVSGGLLVNFVRKGGGDGTVPLTDLCVLLDRAFPQFEAGEFPAFLAEYAEQRADERLLVDWRLQPSVWNVRTAPDIFNKRLKDACVRAGVPHVTPHMMRHAFVTNLLRAGVPLHLVSRMANHTSPTVTSRYIKAGGSELREWMASVTPRG